MASTSFDHRLPRQRYNVRGPPPGQQQGKPGQVQHTADFGDPKVFSRKMFAINGMSRQELMDQLGQLRQRYDASSSWRQLQRLLKNYYRRQRAMAIGGNKSGRVNNRFAAASFYDYLIVIDFECTCEDNVYDYEHEIIEFPAVLVDVHKQALVDEFRSFVQPVLRPVLSDFAVQLTGVTQADVDAAPRFIEVLQLFRQWCVSWGMGTTKKYAIVTDGPWDLAKFFQMQCYFSGMDGVPHDYRHYINLRRVFSAHYPESKNRDAKLRQPIIENADDAAKDDSPDVVDSPAAAVAKQQHRQPGTCDWRNLNGMLDYLGLAFEGREHCGLDDARNIARIVVHLVKDGAEIRINERLLRRDLADRLQADRRRQREQQQQPVGQQSNRHLVDSLAALSLNKQQSPSAQQQQQQSKEDKDRQQWRELLAYKTVTVTRHEFIMEMYDDCDTCGEQE